MTQSENHQKLAPARFDFVYVLKFIAIVMIVNSHSKWMYPESLSALGIGGAWGCALFFFVSGFTKANMKTENFLLYVARSVLRIYPAVWIWCGVEYLLTGEFSVMDLVWPKHWFLQSLLVYYALFYPMMKYGKRYLPHLITVGVVATVACYVMSDNGRWFIDLNSENITRIWYFVIMLFGAWCRNAESLLNPVGGGKKWLLPLMLFVSFCACYGTKFVCTKYDSLVHLQWLFPVVLFCVSYLISSLCRQWTFSTKAGVLVIRFVADRTLEIYIVQNLFIWQQYGAPLTPVGAIAVTLLCATALHWVVQKTFGRIRI